MRFYLNKSVWTAGLERIRRIFDEFQNVLVCFSGGKDSTVTLNLTLMVAAELDRLPVDVLFLDQEAEWQVVIDYIRRVMADPRVKPFWFQGPFRIFNATSNDQLWLHCWEDGADWIRPKEPGSMHENRLGCDRFARMFGAFAQYHCPNDPLAMLGGVRCEESPGRTKGLTGLPTYKDITWGKTYSKRRQHFTFYPLYDWGYVDIWKAIHDNRWPYCRLYDYLWQYGIKPRDMRVSSVHHESAVHTLRFLQEIEPDTWNKIAARVSGVNAVSQVREAYLVPAELPSMFSDWYEYRDYLVEHLVADPEIRATFTKQFARLDRQFVPGHEEAVVRCELTALLVNDYHMTKIHTFVSAHLDWKKSRGMRPDRYSNLKAPE